MFEGDLQLRDGLAFALIKNRLSERRDVDYRFFPAWRRATPEGWDASGNVLFLGRPKLFHASPLVDLASQLESSALGRFSDAKSGMPGDTVRYGKTPFMRREMDAPAEHYKRCDRDYGIFIHRIVEVDGEPRRVAAIAGLGMLGTLGLTLVLTDDVRRAELAEQCRELRPDLAELPVDASVEFCVRIAVDGDADLANFLNRLRFDFQLQVIAVGEETTPTILAPVGTRFTLAADLGGRGGGVLRFTPSGPTIRLTAKRFRLLQCLVGTPDAATSLHLCRILEIVPRTQKELTLAEKVRLAKLVHDVNASVRRNAPAIGDKLIRFDDKLGRYVLHRARGTLAAGPAGSGGDA
jgi:hypothetical protein